ncbi:MAG: hypothetical protein LBG97_07360 [Coriobacteriales bacterium]|jgi:hypothetical protein|nr:hypothetical protein [Coriobacteriales bacterium]
MINQFRVQKIRAEISECERILDISRVNLSDLHHRLDNLTTARQESDNLRQRFYDSLDYERYNAQCAIDVGGIRFGGGHEESMREVLFGHSQQQALTAFLDMDDCLKQAMWRYKDKVKDEERRISNLTNQITNLQIQLRIALAS